MKKNYRSNLKVFKLNGLHNQKFSCTVSTQCFTISVRDLSQGAHTFLSVKRKFVGYVRHIKKLKTNIFRIEITDLSCRFSYGFQK